MNSMTYGITLESTKHIRGRDGDDVEDPVEKIVDSLNSFAKPPMVRIVFDAADKTGESYKDACAAIKKKAPRVRIMAELLDSHDVSGFSVDGYRSRAKDYWSNLHKWVDVWEVGNEVNGDWTGKHSAAKYMAAWEVLDRKGARTAITGYYSRCCEDINGSMLAWLEQNVLGKMRETISYAWVS